MNRTTRKHAIAGIVALLVGALCALNAVTQRTWEREKADRKALLETRRRQELGLPATTESETPERAFEPPSDSGPPNAPVRIAVYFNSTNGCLKSVVDAVAEAATVYGDLVHVNYRDTLEPAVQTDADARQIGCESAIFFNDEMVRRAQPGEFAGLKKFLGPPNEGNYATSDIYGAINYLLQDAGIEPPAEARVKANAIHP